MRTLRSRTVLFFALLLTFALVAAACGDAVEIEADPAEVVVPEEEEAEEVEEPDADGRWAETITIGWTPPDITGVFMTATEFFDAAAAEGNEHGFNIEVLSRSPATHVDFADQLAIVEDYITLGVDVIAISPADTEAIKPAIKQANDAGIPVILVNLLEEQADIEIASYIGFDNTEAAMVSAYSVLDYFGGPGVLGDGEKVDVDPDQYLDLEFWQDLYADADTAGIQARGVIIEGIAGTFFSQARLDGFYAVIEDIEGIEILAAPIAADWNREKGIEATETFLSRFGAGELDFIWAASNEMGLGAMLTADRVGRLDDTGGSTPPGEGLVAIFTNDVTPESADAIRDGGIVAETHHGFPEWGWFGTEFAVKLACGIDVPDLEDIRPRTAWENNAGLFYPEPELPAIDWDDIRANCR
jgi:ribose transport system substrate-binding protein